MTEHIGNAQLLEKHKIGFMAPSHVAPLSVIPTLDWAISQSTKEDIAVMSGFSSQTEKDVLSFLLRGQCGIILVLARRHYTQLPEEWKALLDSGRLLIISTSTAPRQSKQSAFLRNQYICEHCDELVMPSVPIKTSSLYQLYETYNPLCINQ